jgi:transcriptional regulator with XRE-family HTH domain
MDVARAFGRALQAIRQSRRISQEVLAHRSGYHRTYISLLERGLRTPTLETVLKLATVLEISATEMVAEVENVLAQDDSVTKE